MGHTKREARRAIDRLTKATGGDYIVTFGKHVGKRLEDIPSGYVDWMVRDNIGRDDVQRNIQLMRDDSSGVPAVAACGNDVPF